VTARLDIGLYLVQLLLVSSCLHVHRAIRISHMRTSSIESLKMDALQGHRLKSSRGKADKLVPQSMQTATFAGNTLVQNGTVVCKQTTFCCISCRMPLCKDNRVDVTSFMSCVDEHLESEHIVVGCTGLHHPSTGFPNSEHVNLHPRRSNRHVASSSPTATYEA
jgi:hypothetical protein